MELRATHGGTVCHFTEGADVVLDPRVAPSVLALTDTFPVAFSRVESVDDLAYAVAFLGRGVEPDVGGLHALAQCIRAQLLASQTH